MSNILALGMVAIGIGGLYRFGWTVTGLIYDVFGVTMLLELDRLAEWARFRHRMTGEGDREWKASKRKLQYWRLLPLSVARKCASRKLEDVMETPLDESIPMKAWALLLLLIGFVFQAVGGLIRTEFTGMG